MSADTPSWPTLRTIAREGVIVERRTRIGEHVIVVRPGPLDFDCQIDGKHHGSYWSIDAACLAAAAHLDLSAR